MLNKLVVRTSKNAFYKTSHYSIKINGVDAGQINANVLKSEFELPLGKHLVEISNRDKKIIKEIVFTANQFKIVSISPSLSYEFIFGLTIGGSICFGLISIFVLFRSDFDAKFLPIFLLLIPVVTQIFRRKRHFTISLVK